MLFMYMFPKNRKFPITTQLKMKGEKWATLSLFPVADMNANKHVSFGFKAKRRSGSHVPSVFLHILLDMFVKDKPDFFFWAIYTSQICMNLRWASSFGHLLGVTNSIVWSGTHGTSENSTPSGFWASAAKRLSLIWRDGIWMTLMIMHGFGYMTMFVRINTNR